MGTVASSANLNANYSGLVGDMMIAADTGDLRGYFPADPRAHRQHDNHSADADDDAQHGERRPHFVDPQRP